MKNICFILLLLSPLYALSQDWNWVKQVGGNAQYYDGGSVITDGQNYYLYGTFSGTMILQTDTFNSNGCSDFYIIKYDGGGTELWAKSFGGYNGTDPSETMGCVYDSVNNCIFISGKYFGDITLGNHTILGGGPFFNNFLARMDPDGNFDWAKNAWTKSNYNLSSEDGVPRLSVQPNGIINIITSVIDTASFDGLSVIPGGCLAKFDSDGNCFFARHLFAFSGANQGSLGVIQFEDDMIVYGGFKQSFELDTATLTSNGDYDMLLARLDSNGSSKWINQFGSGSTDYITHMSIDNYSNLYAVGGFTDSVSFSGNTFYNSPSDFIFMKFDENGNFLFANQAHSSTSFLDPGRMINDRQGNSYITGSFSGSASFGGCNVSTNNLEDMFLVSYDSSGSCLGVKNFGRAGGSNVVIDNSGNPVVAGIFSGVVAIDNETFTSNGLFDIYLAKGGAITGNDVGRLAHGQLIIYANPNAGKCKIRVPEDFLHEKNLILSIYDNQGRLIQQKNLQMNDGKISLNLEAEPKGVYNVTLNNAKISYSGRIVFQ